MIALLSEYGVSQESMDELAKAECTSVCLFSALADDRESMRKAIKSLIGLDPANGKSETIEMAKIIAAWKTSNIRSDVVVKANAEREANFLPTKVPEKELEMAQLAYEKFEDIELTDEVAPGQAYFERKVTELSSTLKAEPLTMVTTKAHDELYRGMLNLGADPVSGLFKISQKNFGVILPRDSEEFRVRLTTLGILHGYLRMKARNRRCFETCTERNWTRYTSHFLGKEVWGLATRNLEGVPISTPDLEHVLTYEFEVRKAIMKRMNQGMDFYAAFNDVRKNAEHKQIHFLHHIALRPSRSVTAPGMRGQAPPAGPGSQGRLDLVDAEPIATGNRQLPAILDYEPGKSKKKGENRNARLKRQLDDARRQIAGAPADRGEKRTLAILDDPGRQPKKGKGKGKDKGKGKGLPQGVNLVDHDDRLCIGYNKGNCTFGDKCRYLHKCWWCGQDHAGGMTKQCS